MKKYMLLVSLLALLASCTQDIELTVTPDVPSWTFDADGGSFDVVIFTDGSWKATCDDPAVTFAPDSGDFTMPMHVTVGKNEEMYTKSIRISLVSSYSNLSRGNRIVITQTCNPFIFCEESEKTIGAEGGAVRFSVNADHDWSVVRTTLDGEACTLTVDPSSQGPNRTEVAVWIPENETSQPRSFAVTLALDDYPDKTLTLTVTQE